MSRRWVNESRTRIGMKKGKQNRDEEKEEKGMKARISRRNYIIEPRTRYSNENRTPLNLRGKESLTGLRGKKGGTERKKNSPTEC
jgi:hypothetical protein